MYTKLQINPCDQDGLSAGPAGPSDVAQFVPGPIQPGTITRSAPGSWLGRENQIPKETSLFYNSMPLEAVESGQAESAWDVRGSSGLGQRPVVQGATEPPDRIPPETEGELTQGVQSFGVLASAVLLYFFLSR